MSTQLQTLVATLNGQPSEEQLKVLRNLMRCDGPFHMGITMSTSVSP